MLNYNKSILKSQTKSTNQNEHFIRDLCENETTLTFHLLGECILPDEVNANLVTKHLRI